MSRRYSGSRSAASSAKTLGLGDPCLDLRRLVTHQRIKMENHNRRQAWCALQEKTVPGIRFASVQSRRDSELNAIFSVSSED